VATVTVTPIRAVAFICLLRPGLRDCESQVDTECPCGDFEGYATAAAAIKARAIQCPSIEQRLAARRIHEGSGIAKAIGYCVGEKLLAFVRTSDADPEIAAELPAFVETVKEIFSPGEIREYSENLRRVGALGHVAADEEVEFMRAANPSSPC
jgi:hypothetical protein